MAFARFRRLLKESIGLDAASIGLSAIERAVHDRVTACGVSDVQRYWDRVSTSPEELQQLIEAVVVSETWFFRDPAAFSTLARFVGQEWLPAEPDRVVRVLSLPCATGEEPYSIAMAFLDAGVPLSRVLIDAIDISAQAVAQARKGNYRKHSFRGRQLAFRARYFDAIPTGYRLHERVRRHVQFRQGNVFAADSAIALERYDAIFCRNLLIYFDRETQDRAIRTLERHLSPHGVLFVAPSETGVLMSNGFLPVNAPHAFAFRPVSGSGDRTPRAGSGVRPDIKAAVTGTGRSAIVLQPKPLAPPPLRHSQKLPAAASVPPQATAESKVDETRWLEDAVELANRGSFEEAVERCERHLVRFGPSAEAFHLIGLVRDASGDSAEAVGCYRKALYLDPQHRGALIQLALLLERLGKKSEAQLLRRRANRQPARSAVENAHAV